MIPQRPILLYLTVFLITISFFKLRAQPSIVWDKTYGGSLEDGLNKMILLDDQMYGAVGYTYSTDSDIVGNHGGTDAFVLKLNPKNGTIIWKKVLGGDGFDQGLDIIQLYDGNLLMLGRTVTNNNGDVHNHHGSDDIWLVKLDQSNGDTLWTNCYGGSGSEMSKNFIQHTDGSIYVTGNTTTNNGTGDVPVYKGGFRDAWVVKVNEQTGQKIWAKTYGGTTTPGLTGSGNDDGYYVIEALDGQIVLANYTTSNNTVDLVGAGFHYDGGMFARNDIWIVKIDTADGSIIWHRCVGGDHFEQAAIGVNSIDSSIIFMCASQSNNGDVHNAHGGQDYFVFSMSLAGDTNWCRAYGGSSVDMSSSIVYSESDNSVLVFGQTQSTDGDVHNKHASGDIWVTKINASTGDTLWTRAYGGKGYDLVVSTPVDYFAQNVICTDNDKGVVFTAYTNTDTIDGDKTEVTPSGMGTQNASWIVRIDEAGKILWDKTISANGPSAERPGGTLLNKDGSYGVWYFNSTNDSGGHKTSLNLGNRDWWIVQLEYSNNTNNQLDFTYNIYPCSDSVLFQIYDADSIKKPTPEYYWDFGDYSTTDSITEPYIVHRFLNPQEYSISLIKEMDCMSDTTIKLITLSDLVTLNIVDDTLFCEQDIININTGYDSLIHLWSTNDTASSINIDDEGAYWVTLTKDSTCQITDSFTIYLVIDSTNIEFNDTTINKGDSIRYEIIGNGNIKWTSNQVEIICDTCSTITVYPSVNPSQISIEYQIGNNCIVNKTINISILEPGAIFLPNVIQQSGSINNSFGLANLSEEAENYALTIIDRLGQKVFETTNNKEQWTGKKQDGTLLPEGAYLYQLSFEIDGTKQEFKGNITLLR